MSDICLALRSVTFWYEPDRPVLGDVGLVVREGERVALMGRNGAGKTTALHLLVGLLRPQRGQVEAFGQICGREQDFLEVRRRVALLFQNSDDQLFCPTVIEDVAFGPLNLGKSPTEARALATEALARVGMVGYENRITHHLSAGEMKLAALAGLLSMRPAILLLDEPSSNLDPRARRRLIELLKSFEQTQIIATQDQELAVEVCSRVVVLDGGKVVVDGPARDILADEALMLAHGLERPHILRRQHPH
ncbi:MAG: energy-coupling factor ABC transporter ATP-binding protein [Verrucomicrobiota bacterium]|nr:energy-coupling factor ABC transporter ATP-binding protein [Verrucomicrobiota bacterium]